jgi:hypothetical protein
MTKRSGAKDYVIFGRKFPQICIRGNWSLKRKLAVLPTLTSDKSPTHSSRHFRKYSGRLLELREDYRLPVTNPRLPAKSGFR